MDTKIAIALPTNRGLKPKCLQSLLVMVANKNYEIIVSTKGFNTAENRNYLAAQAVKRDCTHVLFVDDDMIYEPDTLDKLLAADKDVVGANYSVRAEVEGAHIIEYIDEHKKLRDSSEDDISAYYEANGFVGEELQKNVNRILGKIVFPCRSLGGGCMLVKTEVFKRIPQPWFGYEWYENGMVKVSNDWFFCRKLPEVWCEPSIKPIHIGSYEF